MTLSADDVDYLLAATSSAVKRFGGSGPTLSHLALVLSDKWSSEFVEVFGEGGSDQVALLLRRNTFVGDESDVRELLAASGDKKPVLSELRQRLSEPIAQAVAEAAAKETNPEPPPSAALPAESGDTVTEHGWAERTRRFVCRLEPREDLLERDEEVVQVVSVLSRTRRRVPAIVGARGSGRTALLGGIVHKLNSQKADDPMPVWRTSVETLGADPAGALSRIVDDCESPAVLVIDDFDQLAALGTSQPNIAVLRLMAATVSHPYLRIVLVCDSRLYRRLGIHAEDLVEQLATVRVDPLGDKVIEEIVRRSLPSIAAAHGVSISAALQSVALLPARPVDGAVQPGLAVDRLDAAASRAGILGDPEADVVHLAGFSGSRSHGTRVRDLEEQLARRVLGQDAAVRTVASRLALTLGRLDLRPERPDGVFLFVGPTGVGKTELARALSATLFGSEDRLIRLDMSEYSHDWAVSRIVGPMPGFVGSTEPESWLTTKVTQMPECVVLLDEIEKAHPVVWNTFLQVFDAGRLTDSRGMTADFSGVVMVMTSNLGAAAATGPGLGFAGEAGSATRARDTIIRAVKDAMAPELINRIDELVVFDALSIEAIESIAEQELSRMRERLAELGWSVTHDADVVSHLVATGYDPAYGARHLQRNIERLYLGLIAQSESRNVAVSVVDGEMRVDPVVR